MSSPDLPSEAWDALRQAQYLRENAMEFAIPVEVCTGPDGDSLHYIRIGQGGERWYMTIEEAADLPEVDHFLYTGTPPLRIVGTFQQPKVCEFCTFRDGP